MPLFARAKPRDQKNTDQKNTKKTRDRGELDAIHDRVVEAVASLGESPTVQAVQLGVSRSTRDRWFKPNALPTLQHLFRIADRTGFSVAWMLGLDSLERGRTTLSVARGAVIPFDRHHLTSRDASSSRHADTVESLDLRAHVEFGVDQALRGMPTSRSLPEEGSLPAWVERIRSALAERSEGIDALCQHAVRAEIFECGNRYRRAMLDLADLMTLDSSRVFEPDLTARLLTKAADIRRFAESLSSFEAMVNMIPEMEHIGPIVGAGLGTSGSLVLESRFDAVAPSLGVVWRGKHRDYAWYLEVSEDETLQTADGGDILDSPKPRLCAIAQKRGRFLKVRAGMSFIEQLAAITDERVGSDGSSVPPEQDEDAAFIAMLEMS